MSQIPPKSTVGLRLPGIIREASQQMAGPRFTSESEIYREAILHYLRAHGYLLTPVQTRPTSSEEVSVL